MHYGCNTNGEHERCGQSSCGMYDDCPIKNTIVFKDREDIMTVKIKRLNDNAKIPTRGSEYAAGYDLYACLDSDYLEIEPHKTEKVSTGIALELPHGYFGAIFARSGLATKKNLRPSNCVGVCDEDYTGEYIVALHNDSDYTKTIANGERIAQLIVLPYLSVDFEEVNELTETERGNGGFGSTGKA